MHNNIFMLSDASYSYSSKIAGIGVVDTSINKEYQYTLNNVKSIYEAEYKALLYSIKIALDNNYKNVIFVYDAKFLKLENIKQYTKTRFECAQFIWAKREYLQQSDFIAKSVRKATEKKYNPFRNIGDFRKLKDTQILKACLLIADDRQKEIILGYMKNKVIKIYDNENKLLGIGKNGIDFFKFVYLNLSETHQLHFFHYVSYICPGTLPKTPKARNRLSEQKQLKYIKQIMHKINERKKFK